MKKIISLLIALATAAPSAVVFADTENTSTDNEFLSQISALVSETMSDDYIGSLNLTIGSDTMTLDGEQLKIDNEGSVPVIENDTTLLPIRGVAEAVGADVEYSAALQTVSLFSAETEVNLQIGSTSIEINGEIKQMPVAAKIENNRTLIPLRAATEALGCDVDWDDEAQTITLTKPYQSKRIIVFTENSDTCGASDVIVGDGITVLQFDTEAEARECVEVNQNLGFEAEPDYICKTDSLSWGTEKINAPAYYNAYSASQSDLIVAVVDTGLDSSNSCFNNKIVSGYDIYNNDKIPEDSRGHGTHVASTIADITSGFNKVKIMPIKVFGTEGTTSSLIVSSGITYAVNAGAKVINLSLGGAGESMCEKQAIEKALAKNVTVVAAAGNDNINLCNNYYSPACISGVVTVASVNSENVKASSSNYGNGVIDFAAPGVNVVGAAIGGGTTTKSGTSMASPHITGAIALIRCTNSKLSSAEAINTLKTSADSLGNSSYYGVGIPNLSKLVKTVPVTSNIIVTTLDASNIEYTNAQINGSVRYTGSKPSEVGIYFGNSKNNLKKVAKDNITHNKNPFDMWYDLNTDAGQILSDGTTYYYQCYAIQKGTEYKGEIKSFTTKTDDSSINIKTTEAKYITDTNATVYGNIEYFGNKPSEVGIYFGKSRSNMNKVAKDTSITHNKNPFDMWYDLNIDAKQTLSANTKYYWQCYAIVDGKEYKSDINSFTTNKKSSIYVTTGSVEAITSTNAKVNGSAAYSDTKPSEVGLYFGTSANNIVKVAKDDITHNKNPFDIWYDLNAEANLRLSSNTTYYYQIYAIQNGKEICGELKTFTTQ